MLSIDDEPQVAEPEMAGYAIKFTPMPDLYRKGNETVRLLRELARMGDVAISCDAGSLPLLDNLDPRRRLSHLAGRTVDQRGHRRDRRAVRIRRRRLRARDHAVWLPRGQRGASIRATSADRRRAAGASAPLAAVPAESRPEPTGGGRAHKDDGRPGGAGAGGPGSGKGATGTRQSRGRGADDPRRSRSCRSADQSGRRAGDQSGDAFAARDGGRARALLERGGGSRRARAADARNPGRRHGDPRPAGQAAVPAHVAHRPRIDRRHGKIGAAANRGRGDRSRQNRRRAAGRSAHPYDPQRGRSRRREAGGSRGGGQAQLKARSSCRRRTARDGSSSRFRTTAPASTGRAFARSPSRRN